MGEVEYDAIIVGGSFAGLAVASQLRGNILLIDNKEIGARQTSTCGTVLSVPEKLNCLDSVLQVYNTGFIHTSSKTVEYDLPYPFCAFDYQKFCQTLVKRVEVKTIKANVRGLMDGCVMTDEGSFRGICIIDASGWKAVLASSLESDFVHRSKMSSGIETTVNYQGEGLHFWVDPQLIKQGIGWLFPVGDAAGQCEPLTGFGIRPAIYFGLRCAAIVQRVIDREISLEEGLQHYNELVRSYHGYYTLLEGLQKGLLSLPNSWLTQLLVLLSHRPICHFLLRRHQRHAPLEEVMRPDVVSANSIEVLGKKYTDWR